MKSLTLKQFHLAVLLACAVCIVPALAQRASTQPNTSPAASRTSSARTNQSTPANQSITPSAAPDTAAAARAPQSFKARYDGGVFGYNRKIEGTLAFEDADNRLAFRDKRGQVLFVIPYTTISAAFADTQSRRPRAATVIGNIPAPYGLNLPALFVRNKYRYLTMQYKDNDTSNIGTTSFKVGNKQLLEAVLNAVAAKAELTRRGEIFVRPRDGEPKTGVYEVATPTQK